MTLFLVIITFLYLSNCISLIDADNLVLVHEQPIHFDALITDIYKRAVQSVAINKDIIIIYENVFGPTNGLNGIKIGQLTIYFNPTSSKINISKHKDGIRYFDPDIYCDKHSAKLSENKRIPNGLSMTQMFKFAVVLLQEIRVKCIWLPMKFRIKYIGCRGEQESIPWIDLKAIGGRPHNFYD